MPNIPAMLAAAHDIKAQLDALLLRGRVQDSGEHRVAATQCLTIAEQFSATLHLIEGGRGKSEFRRYATSKRRSPVTSAQRNASL